MYNLGQQFIFDSNKAKAKDAAIYKGNTYRISILTERLIRIEYNKNGVFEDRPTELVLFRDFEVPNLTVKQDAKYLEITSKYFKLTYNKEADIKSVSNLKIYLESTNKIWHYTNPEVRNYGATMMSLDDDKNLKYNKGLYSTDGFASIDDSNSFVINPDGTLSKRDVEGIDIYVFLYRKDFGLCLKDYFRLTGIPPMLPRYAFGIWWSKNDTYSEESLNKLFLRFTKEQIPISVLLLDKDWHIRNVNEYKDLITGYTFNRQLFPNPVSFINMMHNRGVKVGLHVNPVQGIWPHEEMYSKIREYVQIEENKPIAYAPFNPKFIDIYLKLLIHPLEAMGIDFFWNDFYDKNNRLIHFLNSHYGFIDSGRMESKRSMFMARNPMVAAHRYGVLYSGNIKVSWNMLKMLPEYNSTSSNIGLSWWSHDVGGYYEGIEDGELYLRHVQLGCFSPIFRIHVDKGKYYKREPWKWDVQTYEIVKYYMQLRNKLVPYIYSEAYRYHKIGSPLIQPLYYKHPEIYDNPLYKNEYYFGTEFLVAPITSKKDLVMNRVVHKFYLPTGLWYDFKTGKKFPGDRSYVSFFKDEDYPVFVKSGGIIPLSKDISNDVKSPDFLEIHIFPGKSNTYNLYEDDGISNLYKQGYYLLTSIDYNYQENNYTVIVRAIEGKSGIVPATRNYRFRFRNTKKTDDLVANFDGTDLPTTSYEDENDFIVEVKNVSTIGQLTVNCRGKAIEIDAVRLINEDIDGIISDLAIETSLKDKISDILFSNIPIKKKRIQIRKLKRDKLDEKFIKMFIRLLEYIEQI
jgi:alpha-glucosidase (family GH31 glycosyl hydrolase)